MTVKKAVKHAPAAKKTGRDPLFKRLFFSLLAVVVLYTLWQLVPARVKNVMLLQYKQKELAKEMRTTGHDAGASGIVRDYYGQRVQVLPGPEPGSRPTLVSRGGKDGFGPGDVVIEELVKKTVRKTLEEVVGITEFRLETQWHTATPAYGDKLYAAMYRYWQEHFPLATVIIPNDVAVKNVRLNLSLGKYGGKVIDIAGTPATSIVNIMPEFNTASLAGLREPETVRCSLKMGYEYHGVQKTTETFHNISFRPVSEFSWDDPLMLACFVTAQDKAAADYSGLVAEMFTDKTAGSRLKKLGAIFYAVNSLGLNAGPGTAGCMFPGETLGAGACSPESFQLLFSRLLSSGDIANKLLASPADRKLVVMADVEKILSEAEKGFGTTVVNVGKSLIPNILPFGLTRKAVDKISAKLIPPKVSFSARLAACYERYNGSDYLFLALTPGTTDFSLLSAAEAGRSLGVDYLSGGKATVIDIEQARKEGYDYPEGLMPAAHRAPVPEKSAILKAGGSELKKIFDAKLLSR